MTVSLHTKFLTYLEKDARIKDEKERERLADFAETRLPAFIRQYLDMNFEGLYEKTDRAYYELMRANVFSTATAKAENNAEGEKYTTILKYIAGFYGSKTFKGREKVRLSSKEKAYKVDGETRQPVAAEPGPEPVVKTDYLLPSDDEPLTEGRIRQVSLTVHERNRKYRQICLAEHGYVCAVCQMDFEKAYGEIGREFIEVHHLTRIADTEGEHEIDPKRDLAPLCSNCHSMIHRKEGGEPFTIDELKQRYKGPRWSEL